MSVTTYHLPKVAPDNTVARIRAIARVVAFLEGLPLNKSFRNDVKPARSERSEAMNDYYWAVVAKMIGEAWGFTAQQAHEYLCGDHFGWVQKKCPPTPSNPSGIEDVPRRTTTTDEDGNRDVLQGTPFWEFVESARQFGAMRLHIYIPDPDPMYKFTDERHAA